MEHSGLLTALAFKVLLALGVVLLLVAGAAWIARRMGVRPRGGATRQGPELLATTHLDPRHAVHLVRVGDSTVLVGTSREGITSLGTFPLPADLPRADASASKRMPGTPGGAFLDYVEAALRGGKKSPAGDAARAGSQSLP